MDFTKSEAERGFAPAPSPESLIDNVSESARPEDTITKPSDSCNVGITDCYEGTKKKEHRDWSKVTDWTRSDAEIGEMMRCPPSHVNVARRRHAPETITRRKDKGLIPAPWRVYLQAQKEKADETPASDFGRTDMYPGVEIGLPGASSMDVEENQGVKQAEIRLEFENVSQNEEQNEAVQAGEGGVKDGETDVLSDAADVVRESDCEKDDIELGALQVNEQGKGPSPLRADGKDTAEGVCHSRDAEADPEGKAAKISELQAERLDPFSSDYKIEYDGVPRPPAGVDLAQWATWYLQLGFRLFPLPPNSKKPLMKNWQDRATNDPETVKKWLSRGYGINSDDDKRLFPVGGWAIATGQGSGVFVLDVDVKDNVDGRASLKAILGDKPLPDTLTAATGGGEQEGRHYFFKTDREIKNQASSMAPGLDIRGDGGYVVAAPSVHPNTRMRYRFVNFVPPAECPAGLMKNIEDAAAKKDNTLAPGGELVITEGERNGTLYSLACAERAKGATRETIAAVVAAYNVNQCTPPLPADELEKIVESAMTKPAGTAKVDSALPAFEAVKLYEKLDITKQIPKLEMLGGLFPRRDLTCWAGEPGVGKTLLLQYIAAALTKGKDLWGRRFDPLKVLYFAGETPVDDMARRGAAGAWEYDQDLFISYDGMKLAGAGVRYLLKDVEGQEFFRSTFEEHKPDVVFIDGISWYSGGDEVKNDKVINLLLPLRIMAQESNAAVVFVHHTRKRKTKERGPEPELDEVSGAGAFGRLAAYSYALWKKDKDVENAPVTVKCLKHRHGYIKRFTFTISAPPARARVRYGPRQPLHHIESGKSRGFHFEFRPSR